MRARRAELGITQEELAERCEMDRTFISSVERGQKNPSFKSIWIFAEGLEVSPAALMRRTQELLASEEP